MPRLATPLFVLIALFAGSANAAPPSPLSCDAFLKRACSKQEQAHFDRGTKQPAVTARAGASRDCDSLLGRTCSKQERTYFDKGAKKPVNARSENLAPNCDSFLKRSCNSREAQGFAQGTKPRLALASN